MAIWRHETISKLIPKHNQLTLGEGNTPLKKVFLNSKELAFFGIRESKTQKLFLKLETENPNKSFKDRSLAYQISYYLNLESQNLLISSSGNAAISAASYTALTDMKLAVFLSTKANPIKIEKLNQITTKNPNIALNFSLKPKSDALKFANYGNYINLRGSVDEAAVIGFKTLGYELSDQLPQADAVFVPCSSATSSVGIYRGYRDLDKLSPQIHVCQTTKIHAIAKDYDVLYERTKTSIADAIADRVAHRRNEITEIIGATNGAGWILDDELIRKSTEFLKEKTGEKDITYNGVLSFAGYIKAMRQKKRFDNPVCIISGI